MPVKKPRTKKQKKKVVESEMRRFKEGKLKSGKNGKVVTSPKQAIAISLHVAGLSKKKKNRSGKKRKK
jgi:hypothetical protein